MSAAPQNTAANDRPLEVNGHDSDALMREIAALKTNLASLSRLLLERGTEKTEDAAQRFAPAAKQAFESTQTSIRARPVLSMLLVFLIGLLFGRLVLRR